MDTLTEDQKEYLQLGRLRKQGKFLQNPTLHTLLAVLKELRGLSVLYETSLRLQYGEKFDKQLVAVVINRMKVDQDELIKIGKTR